MHYQLFPDYIDYKQHPLLSLATEPRSASFGEIRTESWNNISNALKAAPKDSLLKPLK